MAKPSEGLAVMDKAIRLKSTQESTFISRGHASNSPCLSVPIVSGSTNSHKEPNDGAIPSRQLAVDLFADCKNVMRVETNKRVHC